MLVDTVEGAPSVTQSPKRQSPRRSPGVLGPFLTGPLATDYSDAPQQQQKTAVDEAMELDAAGLVFPTVPAFGDADGAEEATAGAVRGFFAAYTTEERARVVSTCESDTSSVMYAASNATQENYGWTNEQQQQQQDVYGQQQQTLYQNGYPQDPNGYNGTMVDASYGANASYADVVSRQRSGSVAMVRSHDTFDSLSEGMVESMSRILSKTNGGRTNNEVQLACLIQKIQTHLKIMGQVSGGIRADYYETASKLKQVLAEKRMLEAHNQELQERIQQLDQDRQYFQMHVLQFQQSQSAILQDSFGHLSQSVAEAKQATLDLGARMSYEIGEASRNGGSGAVASGNSSHLEAKVDRLTQAVLDQRNHAAAAAASTVASKLPPHQSTADASAPVPLGWKGPSFLLVGGGLLFWGVSIASVYFGAKSLAIAEFQEQQPQVVSPSLVASDLDMIVDRITQRLQRDGHVAKASADVEPLIVDEVKLDEILDNWKAPLEEEPEMTRELEQQQPHIEMTDEIHDIVVDEITSFIETEMAQPEQVEAEVAEHEQVVFASVEEPVAADSVEGSDDEVHDTDLEQADAVAAEEESGSADDLVTIEPKETDENVIAGKVTTETIELELEEAAFEIPEATELELEETASEIPEANSDFAESETVAAESAESNDIFASETMIEAVVPADLSFADVEVTEFETEAAITKDQESVASEIIEPVSEMPSSNEAGPEDAFDAVIPVEELDDQAATGITSEDSLSSITLESVDVDDVVEEASVDLSITEREDLRENEQVDEMVAPMNDQPIIEELDENVDYESHDSDEQVVEEPVVVEVIVDNSEEEVTATEVESVDTNVDTRPSEETVVDDEKESLDQNNEEMQDEDESVIAGVILNPLARLAEALKSSTEFVFGSQDSVTLDDNEGTEVDHESLYSEDSNASDGNEDPLPETKTLVNGDSDIVEEETQEFVDEGVQAVGEFLNVESLESKSDEKETVAANVDEDVFDVEAIASIEPEVYESVESKDSSHLTDEQNAETLHEDTPTSEGHESFGNDPIFQDIVPQEQEIAIETEEPEITSIIDEAVIYSKAQEPDVEETEVDSEEESLSADVSESLESVQDEVAIAADEDNVEPQTIETVVGGVEGDIVDMSEVPTPFLSSEVEPDSSKDEEETIYYINQDNADDEEETIYYINQDNADEFPFLIESVEGEASEGIADGSQAFDEKSTLETEEIPSASTYQEAEEIDVPESTFEAVGDAIGSVLVDQPFDDSVAESTAEGVLEALNENRPSERLAEEPAEVLSLSEVNDEHEVHKAVDVDESSFVEVASDAEHTVQVDGIDDAGFDEYTVSVEMDLIDHADDTEALSSTTEKVDIVAENEAEQLADVAEDIESDDAAGEEDVAVVASVEVTDDSHDENAISNGDSELNVVEAEVDAIEADVLAGDNDIETIGVEVVADAEDDRELVAIELEEQADNTAESSTGAVNARVEDVAEIAKEQEASITVEMPLEESTEDEIEASAHDADDEAESNVVVEVDADVSAEEEQENAMTESEPTAVIDKAFSETSNTLNDEEAATQGQQEDIAVETPEEDSAEASVISEEPVADMKPTSFFGF